MKNLVLILGLLIGTFLFASEEVANGDDNRMAVNKETVMLEKRMSDMHHCLEVLSSDLKGSNCLTPRRNIQTINYNFDLRVLKGAEKTIQFIRQKGVNSLLKVIETNSDTHTINLSTLLCRMGQHVFVLRKLII